MRGILPMLHATNYQIDDMNLQDIETSLLFSNVSVIILHMGEKLTSP